MSSTQSNSGPERKGIGHDVQFSQHQVETTEILDDTFDLNLIAYHPKEIYFKGYGLRSNISR